MHPQTLCPYCREPIPSNQTLTCLSCGTAHHARCWTEHGSCSVFGCSGLKIAESLTLVSSRRWPVILSLCLVLPVWMLVYGHNFLEDLLWRTPSVPLDAIRFGERFFLGTVLLVPPVALLCCLLARWFEQRRSLFYGEERIATLGLVLSGVASGWSLLVLLMAVS